MAERDVIMRVENLSKLYRLGTVGTGTLADDLNRWWHLARGKEDPYTKVGEANDRSSAGNSDYVWALQDIDFDVYRGEVLGIIGKNGAGKSTLLKILSRVTGPTTGRVRAKGRIASLLEVGTGFHPELTGRENIFLNGAILGMTKQEIVSKLDEIIAFSGCDRYIDTPVKRYSSGMKVRLAFAVAAHLEPDILVVDEVLAVGDAEFQTKAIGKMKDISRGDGRTVLFVSHNMAAVMELCDRGMLMQHGRIHSTGKVTDIIPAYINAFRAEELTMDLHAIKQRAGNGNIRFHRLELLDGEGNPIDYALSGQTLTFRLTMQVNVPDAYPALHVSIRMVDGNDNTLFHLSNSVANGADFQIAEGVRQFSVECTIDRLPLNVGAYGFHLFCSDRSKLFDEINFAGELRVDGGNFYSSGKLPPPRVTSILIDHRWEMRKLQDHP